jgi:hypothetical protein
MPLRRFVRAGCHAVSPATMNASLPVWQVSTRSPSPPSGSLNSRNSLFKVHRARHRNPLKAFGPRGPSCSACQTQYAPAAGAIAEGKGGPGNFLIAQRIKAQKSQGSGANSCATGHVPDYILSLRTTQGMIASRQALFSCSLPSLGLGRYPLVSCSGTTAGT